MIDAAHRPVLTVEPGDEVVMATWSRWGKRVEPGMPLDADLALPPRAPGLSRSANFSPTPSRAVPRMKSWP